MKMIEQNLTAKIAVIPLCCIDRIVKLKLMRVIKFEDAAILNTITQ